MGDTKPQLLRSPTKATPDTQQYCRTVKQRDLKSTQRQVRLPVFLIATVEAKKMTVTPSKKKKKKKADLEFKPNQKTFRNIDELDKAKLSLPPKDGWA